LALILIINGFEARNMENIKERTKKQCRGEPEWEIETEGRRKTWNGELKKYYSYKEVVGSLEELKRYDRFFNFEKTPVNAENSYEVEK
jgi:hypothetical protein